MQRRLRAVEVLDKLADTALIVHDLLDRLIVALIAQRDFQTCIEERLLAQTLFEHIVLVDGRLKDLRVRMERMVVPVSLSHGVSRILTVVTPRSKRVVLGMSVADLGLQPVGQRVYDR